MMTVVTRMFFVSLIFFLNGCVVDDSPPDWNDEVLRWSSYESGVKELKNSGKNGIVILYADWCPTCKEYSGLFRNSDVIEALEGLVLIRIDVDREPEISAVFNLDGEYVPRTYALDSSGEIIKSLNSENPDWWYFLPSDDPGYLAKFAEKVKSFDPAST